MNEQYRGHCIRLKRARSWDAVIVHAETGVVLPTKASALLREGRSVAVARARDLIDLYLDAPHAAARVAGIFADPAGYALPSP